MIGTEIGSYKLVSKIGEGGMGSVWVGEHALLRRRVAVKLLLPELSHDEGIVKRFINEAKASSQIGHRGIVQIFDFGTTEDGTTYMIMELLDGESLQQRIRNRGRLPMAEALLIVQQIADALAAAHAFKIVHRDLKPDNIFVVPDADAPGGERVKILDFGIAKMLDPNMGGPHTKTGSVLGTPVYMAPEQCLATPGIDHRVDIYALGCVFFQLLCGRPPFDFTSIGELISAHVYSQPPLPSSLVPTITPTLDKVILKMLAKKPEDRYGSMREFLDALGETTLEQKDGINDLPTLRPLRPEPRPEAPPAPTEAEQRALKTEIGYVDPKAFAERPRTPAPQAAAPPPAAAEAAKPSPSQPPSQSASQRPKKEITTLSGSVGQKAPAAIPQLGSPRRSSLAMMAMAFGITVPLVLGVFLLFFMRRDAGFGHATPTTLPTTTVVDMATAD